MASRFWLAASIVWLFDSHFSLVHFSGLKYIVARKMRHNARQSDNNNCYISKFITHRIISAGSHWIKLIKIGRWLSDDIPRPIWYPSSDFISTGGKPRNKQTVTLNFVLVKENQKKKTFCRSQWRINKKSVDNSVPRNTKKTLKICRNDLRAFALRNYPEGYEINKFKWVKENRKRLFAEEASDG